MKINVEFDTTVDSISVVNMAVRADCMHVLITDLFHQILEWIDENPGDERAAAFRQVQGWLFDEIRQRGLLFSCHNAGLIRNRAGAIVKNQLDQKRETATSEQVKPQSGR